MQAQRNLDSNLSGDADPARQSTLEAKLAASEAQLAETQAMLEESLRSTASWLWETDAELRFTRVIGNIEQSLGTPPAKLIGKPAILIADKVQSGHIQPYIDAIKAQKPFRDIIIQLKTRQGTRWIKSSGEPVYDAAGAFIGFRGVTHNITPRMETEQRAAAAQRHFMAAIETVPSSLMLCDSEDRIVFCNSATQLYFPLAAHLLVPGTKYEELLRVHVASGYVHGVGDDPESWITERMKRHRNGTTNLVRSYQDGRWAQIIERRTVDGGIIGIRSDITELLKHDPELKRLRDTDLVPKAAGN